MTDLPPLRSWPRLGWRAVLFEVSLYRSLGRWLLRRPAVPEDAEPRGYARSATPVMWLWIFASAAELPLVHVLVPWEGLRLALLVVGAWGLLWMIGLLASLHVHPHLLTTSALRVRNGARHDIAVPWEAISSAQYDDRDLPSTVWALQPLETDEGTDLRVGVSGRVNVRVPLVRPTRLATASGEVTATTVSLWADDPRDLVRDVRSRLADRAATRRPR